MKRPPFPTRFQTGLVALVLSVLTVSRTLGAPPDDVLSLWPDGNPDGWSASARETAEQGADGVIRVRNVQSPQVLVHRPRPYLSRHAAVVICPGGGYNILAFDKEGGELAEWMTGFGVTGVVLKYRLPNPGETPRHGPALQDVQRAIRLVRANAETLGIDPDRIGVLGFSAGGHLATLAGTRFHRPAYAPVDAADEFSARPDFVSLVYPAYLTDKSDGTLLPEFRDSLSSALPPFFFVHTADDSTPAENSLELFMALRKAGVPSELHVYPAGGHGYGLRSVTPGIRDWPEVYRPWLLRQITPAAQP